jgi:hypothetical protein
MDRCCYLFDFGGKNGVFAERECWRLRNINIDIPLAQPQQQVIPEPYSFFEPRENIGHLQAHFCGGGGRHSASCRTFLAHSTTLRRLGELLIYVACDTGICMNIRSESGEEQRGFSSVYSEATQDMESF